MLILVCPPHLDGLAQANVWIANGTFKIVASKFFKLYTIHSGLNGAINPVGVYCPMTSKAAEGYRRLLDFTASIEENVGRL
jgi:hypothetical protein